MSVINAREFAYIVRESALMTPKGSPVLGTDAIYVRLTDGNSLSMYAKPIMEEIPYGGGFAVTAEVISDHYECKAQLKTKLYPTQAQLLLDWATTRINSGQTLPWVTTEVPNDLASCSVYHAIKQNDGTYLRRQFAGCKVAGARIEVSRQSTTASLTLDLVACKQNDFGSHTGDPSSTPFPDPAEANYPTGPYTFAQTSGYLSIGGTTRSMYEDLTINIQNVLDGQWFENAYLSLIPFLGRASTLESTLYLKATPDDRLAYEAITAQAASLTFEAGTGKNLTFTFNGQNTITDLPYDLPLNQIFKQKMTLKNRFDSSAAADLSFSLA